MNRGGKKKTKVIAFRVDEAAFSEVENRALLAGKKMNEWSRDEFLKILCGGASLTANEQLILAEIIRQSNMTLNLFKLAAHGKLNPENYQKVRNAFSMEGREIVKTYFAALPKKLQGG